MMVITIPDRNMPDTTRILILRLTSERNEISHFIVN
jgi:hypothetical protein